MPCGRGRAAPGGSGNPRAAAQSQCIPMDWNLPMTRRRLAALGAIAFSTGAVAAPVHASFSDGGARVLLTTLAAEAGLRLANPEVIEGRLHAVFADEEAGTLLARFAARMGYRLQVEDGEAWLHRDPAAPR